VRREDAELNALRVGHDDPRKRRVVDTRRTDRYEILSRRAMNVEVDSVFHNSRCNSNPSASDQNDPSTDASVASRQKSLESCKTHGRQRSRCGSACDRASGVNMSQRSRTAGPRVPFDVGPDRFEVCSFFADRHNFQQ